MKAFIVVCIVLFPPLLHAQTGWSSSQSGWTVYVGPYLRYQIGAGDVQTEFPSIADSSLRALVAAPAWHKGGFSSSGMGIGISCEILPGTVRSAKTSFILSLGYEHTGDAVISSTRRVPVHIINAGGSADALYDVSAISRYNLSRYTADAQLNFRIAMPLYCAVGASVGYQNADYISHSIELPFRLTATNNTEQWQYDNNRMISNSPAHKQQATLQYGVNICLRLQTMRKDHISLTPYLGYQLQLSNLQHSKTADYHLWMVGISLGFAVLRS